MSRPDVASTWRWDGSAPVRWTADDRRWEEFLARRRALLAPVQDHPDRQALTLATPWPVSPRPGWPPADEQELVDALVGCDAASPVWPGDRLRAALVRLGGELRRALPYLVMLAGAAATVLTSTGWRGGVVLMVLGATVAITAEVRAVHHWLAHELVEAAVRQQLAQRGITVQEEGAGDGTR